MSPELLRERVDAVVIGASAGGVEALLILLRNLLPGFRASVLIVLHIPRERSSLLVEVFQPRCALPVEECQDKHPVDSGKIYVAPPDYHLLVEKGPTLALSVDDQVQFSRPSIDVLFESAADVFGPRLMGIVLTGGNQDGTAGLQAIHSAGGITVVQDPRSAQVPTMPASALSLGIAGFVLPLEGIADLLRMMGGSDMMPANRTGN